MPRIPKVIVIGLDGATWDLIKPWADEGKLPTFKYLMKNYAWGVLESTDPPITFPAWATLFSGKNPAKLGVYSFIQIDVKRRKFKINTPYSFKDMPIWEILSAYGYKSVIINVPTARVCKVNGVIVGGAFSTHRDIIYPQKYKYLLKKINYKAYPSELSEAFLRSGYTPSLKTIKQIISSRFELARYLINLEKPDFVAVVISVIDNLQHFYWGDKIIYYAWKYIDNELGSFITDYYNGDNYIFIVSDHGFTKYSQTFYISRVLERYGLVKFKRSLRQRVLSIIKMEHIFKIARLLKLDKLAEYIPKEKIISIISIFEDSEGRLGSKTLENIIDWDRSLAIPIDNLIYLNCPEERKKKLKEFLKRELLKFDVIENILFKEDIYNGEYIDMAPDIVIVPKKGVDVLESPFAKKVVDDRPGRPRWKGIHDKNGILLVVGPDVNPQKNFSAKIYDIAPTILYLFGIHVPDTDGNVLSEIISRRKSAKKNLYICEHGKSLKDKLKIKIKIRSLRNKLLKLRELNASEEKFS